MPENYDKIQYAYSVARIRVLETRLIDKNKIDRMIESKTAEEALKTIIDINYGYSSNEISNVTEYEKLLSEEQEKAYDLLKEIAPQPEIFDIFLRKNDYHNIKVLLKSEFLNKDFDDILIKTSTISSNKLKNMIKERKMDNMPQIMQEAILESIDTFNRTRDPQLIDIILDKASFAQMKTETDPYKIEFLTNYVESLIDLINIKTFLRIKRLAKPLDFLKKALIQGGSLNQKIFINNLGKSLEEIIDILDHTAYAEVTRKGIEAYIKTSTLTMFEKLSDDYIGSMMRKSKSISLGIEPLLAYLTAKENEIKIIRIIMVGKINNIANEVIRERLRELYV